MKRILVIDDELAMPANSEVFLRDYAVSDFKFEFCASLAEAERRHFWDCALVLLDIRFEGKGDDHGIEILKQIRKRSPSLPVVMLSSRTNSEILIRCWDEGAQAYIVKWTSNARFHADLEEKIRRHARYIPAQSIIGESAEIQELRETIKTLAGYDISVLIVGETGTGKELVARALHEQGKRSAKPFVAVNSAAIPASLIESEMFGHVRGAFTGATDRRGKVEEADGGTLFLDEIADLAPDTQVKLLRLLDSGEFVRIGENRARHTDIRVVAATNRNLETLAKEGLFREDLYFRLNGFKILVPALRQHIEDIPMLVQHFLELFKNAHPEKSSVSSFSLQCIKAMQNYHWPGNVRELRNALERAVILATGTEIAPKHLPSSVLEEAEQKRASFSHEIAAFSSRLPADCKLWSRQRLMAEISACLEAKRHIQQYKGAYWKAEFMRIMYPECKASNAKGFDDLIRRFTKGPWGESGWENDAELKRLLEDLLA